MNSKIIIFLILFFTLSSISFGQNNDSLKIEKLEERTKIIENYQNTTKDELNNKFEKLSNDFKDKYDFLKYLLWFGIGGSFISIMVIIWQSKKYVEKKLNEKFDNIITQKEVDILALIDRQSDEKQIIKKKKILVLTSQDGNDNYLRSFFKAMGFPINNIKYIKTDKYKRIKGFDLIFANNENENLKMDIINDFFNKAENKTVLFYFNTTRKSYINEKVSNKLSFANTKTQIYGNLINLFKFQKTL